MNNIDKKWQAVSEPRRKIIVLIVVAIAGALILFCRPAKAEIFSSLPVDIRCSLAGAGIKKEQWKINFEELKNGEYTSICKAKVGADSADIIMNITVDDDRYCVVQHNNIVIIKPKKENQ